MFIFISGTQSHVYSEDILRDRRSTTRAFFSEEGHATTVSTIRCKWYFTKFGGFFTGTNI